LLLIAVNSFIIYFLVFVHLFFQIFLNPWLGLIAIALASVNIFGGFAVTARMLAMYKKKER
jgi:NAD(P) transhydrogenase subunit alpha